MLTAAQSTLYIDLIAAAAADHCAQCTINANQLLVNLV